MDVATVSQLIGSVGFPIAACFAMFWMVNKSNDQHKEEMDAMTMALNNNTLALNKIMLKLGVDDSGK